MKTEWKIGIFYIIAVISIFVYDALSGAFGGVSDSQIYADIVQFSLIYLLIWLVYSSFADQLMLEGGQPYHWLKISNILKLIAIAFFALLWILNLNGFFAQDDMKILKSEMIEKICSRHRNFIEQVQISNGKTPDEAKAYVALLEPHLQKEKEKFYRYCDGKNSTPYCEITYKWPEYMEITYRYDKDSYAFFNEPLQVKLLTKSNSDCIEMKMPEALAIFDSDDGKKDFYRVSYRVERYTADYSSSHHHNVKDTDGWFYEASCNNPISKERILKIAPNTYIQK